MDNLLPIGTILFSVKWKKVGKIVGYSYNNTYYDIDIDDAYFWYAPETKQITEEEALFYKLKYE